MAKKENKTYRQLFITFWEDEYVKSLALEERYFYIYLLTNDRISFCGIYLLPVKLMQRQTGIGKTKLENMLRKFQQDKKIYYSKETDEICLCNWLKYNCNINNANQMKGIVSSLERVTDKSLIQHLHGIEKVLPQEKQDPMQDPSKDPIQEQPEEPSKEAREVIKQKAESKEQKAESISTDLALEELPSLLNFAKEKIPDSCPAKADICQESFLKPLLLDYSFLTVYEVLETFVDRKGYTANLIAKLLEEKPKRGSEQEKVLLKEKPKKSNPNCPKCKGKGVFSDKKGFYECDCKNQLRLAQ